MSRKTRVLWLIVATLLAISALASASIAANAVTAKPKTTCVAGGINIEHRAIGVTKRKQKDQKAYITGVYKFLVICAPIKGEFDLRLQKWVQRTQEWKSQDVTKKDVSQPYTHNGETFYMDVRAVCANPGETSHESWRLRLFAAPGYASDGTPTPPALNYYPKQGGRQYWCPYRPPRVKR